MTNHTEIFQHYFDTQFWGTDVSTSGPNSDPKFTPQLRLQLQQLLNELAPTTLLDAGCGDANLIQYLDLKDTHYIGVDCVPGLVAQAQATFADTINRQFMVLDIVTEPLPKAELVLCRDVVHYLPNNLIARFLDNVKHSGAKYLLITHNTQCATSANDVTEIGKFRPVNLCYPPFHFPEPKQVIMEDFFAKGLALFTRDQLSWS